jgi:hypothetical protein
MSILSLGIHEYANRIAVDQVSQAEYGRPYGLPDFVNA